MYVAWLNFLLRFYIDPTFWTFTLDGFVATLPEVTLGVHCHTPKLVTYSFNHSSSSSRLDRQTYEVCTANAQQLLSCPYSVVCRVRVSVKMNMVVVWFLCFPSLVGHFDCQRIIQFSYSNQSIHPISPNLSTAQKALVPGRHPKEKTFTQKLPCLRNGPWSFENLENNETVFKMMTKVNKEGERRSNNLGTVMFGFTVCQHRFLHPSQDATDADC